MEEKGNDVGIVIVKEKPDNKLAFLVPNHLFEINGHEYFYFPLGDIAQALKDFQEVEKKNEL